MALAPVIVGGLVDATFRCVCPVVSIAVASAAAKASSSALKRALWERAYNARYTGDHR
jgi:hypothetical protein